jgi:hypothetical protein
MLSAIVQHRSDHLPVVTPNMDRLQDARIFVKLNEVSIIVKSATMDVSRCVGGSSVVTNYQRSVAVYRLTGVHP